MFTAGQETFPGDGNHDVHKMTHSAESEIFGKYGWSFLITDPWCGLLFQKQSYNILSPNFHIHVSVSDLYIPRTDLPILLSWIF